MQNINIMYMSTRNDISIGKSNNEYIIEVYSWDYTKEKAEKELASVDNSRLKKDYLKIYRTTYTHQFDLLPSHNPYLDYFKWLEVSKYLSIKGEAIITRIIEGGKTYYVPAKIVEKHPNQIIIEYLNGEQRKITNPDDYQIILNNPEGSPDNLTQIEKLLDIRVSIEDEISRELVNFRSILMILRNSRIPSEKEIEIFRKGFESDDYVISIPYGTTKFYRPTLSKELRDKCNEVKRILDETVNQEIKMNKEVKFNERMKTLNEMKRKWGIELALNSLY